MENVIFIWDGSPKNYIKVCLESLRLYNKTCIINFFYINEKIPLFLKDLNIKFIKIEKNKWNGRRLHHKLELTKKILKDSSLNSKLLVLDCDLLFQNDPFSMFKKYPNDDFYLSKCVMSLWRNIEGGINGGVKGYRHTKNTIKFLDFWIHNNINLSWDIWKNFKYRNKNHKSGIDWSYCQDFPNCVYLNKDKLPIKLKIRNIGYKYNYFTSTWGFFSKYISMGNKIGNKNYVIIHFKANFKDTYNLDNPEIYNIKNILEKNDLTTKQSRKNIYNKFLSRGEKRFSVV